MSKTHKIPVEDLSRKEILIEGQLNVYKREIEEEMEHFTLLSEEESVFSSPKLKGQVSFSYCLLSVNLSLCPSSCPSVCL